MSTEQREIVKQKVSRIYDDIGGKEADLNEANTRLLIIDEVLLALGWDKLDFNPESYSARSGGYLDYLLKVEGYPRLVVEAKRTGTTFTSPNVNLGKSRSTYSVSYLKSAFGAALTEVIEQTEEYGNAEGVPYGVVTNGLEWIALQLVPTPGVAKQDLKAIYFGNIFDEFFRFDEFFSLLSKSGVSKNAIAKTLSALNRNEAEFSATPALRLGGLVWKRPASEAHRHLEDFYHYFFDEIVDEGRREMLAKCFVSSAQLDQYESDLKRVLKDVAPEYVEDAHELSPGQYRDFLPSVTGDKKGTVILIAGSVGAGKSTFVSKVRIEKRGDLNTKFLVLDLIDEATFSSQDIGGRLYAQVSKKWRELYPESVSYEVLNQVFHAELEELRNGPRAQVFRKNEDALIAAEANLLELHRDDHELFIERSWQYHRKKGMNIILILDNVDRNSEEFQKSAYSFAHHVARKSGVTVIVTMRETTFFRGKQQGFLDVRTSDRIFHLEAPDLVKVISTRLKYVLGDLEGDHRLSKWKKSEDWSERREYMEAFAETLKQSLLTSPWANRSRNILAAASWHNVRQFFSLLRRTHSVIGTDSDTWKFSEVVAALGVRMSEESQPLALTNFFLPPESNTRAHFLRGRVLTWLLRGVREHEARRGVPFQRLYQMLTSIGYGDRTVRLGLQHMVRDRLLECVNVPAEVDFTIGYEIKSEHSFRASPLGVVMLKTVLFEQSYLALSGFELLIQSEEHFSKIVDAMKEVHSMLSDSNLDRHSLSLLGDTTIHEKIACYLCDAMQYERLLGSNYDAEIEAAEDFFESQVILKLSNICPCVPLRLEEDQVGVPIQSQTSLFDLSRGEKKIAIAVPDGIGDAQVGQSAYGPKILWALVWLKANGVFWAQSYQITDVINRHIVEREVSSTNVARALRGPTLRNKGWLEVTDDRRPKYGLGSAWQDSWRELFGSEPPEEAS